MDESRSGGSWEAFWATGRYGRGGPWVYCKSVMPFLERRGKFRKLWFKGAQKSLTAMRLFSTRRTSSSVVSPACTRSCGGKGCSKESGVWILGKPCPGQQEEIDRVYTAYPHLNDDEFVREGRDLWLKQ